MARRSGATCPSPCLTAVRPSGRWEEQSDSSEKVSIRYGCLLIIPTDSSGLLMHMGSHVELKIGHSPQRPQWEAAKRAGDW